MKREVDVISAVPSKRIYRSIIADYGLNTAICELIDNVLDSRTRNHIKDTTRLDLVFDTDDQSITLTDNAGGIEENDLTKLISPGSSLQAGDGTTIGIFGVGSKRAVVALAKDITIVTRSRVATRTFQLEYDDTWLSQEGWDLPYYEVASLPPGTTRIVLSRLRFRIEREDVDALEGHIAYTYAQFIGRAELRISI
jgi:hypothetical protein